MCVVERPFFWGWEEEHEDVPAPTGSLPPTPTPPPDLEVELSSTRQALQPPLVPTQPSMSGQLLPWFRVRSS